MKDIPKSIIGITKQVTPWLIAGLILLTLESRGLSDPLRGGLERLIWPTNQLTNWLVIKVRTPFDYLEFLNQGRLRMANLEQRLKKTSVDYTYLSALEEENRSLKLLMKQDFSSMVTGPYIAASLINGNQQAVINKGSLDKVTEGQIVLDNGGVLVGKVRLTRPHVSIIERPTDSASRIAVKLSRKNTTGILVGQGDGMVMDGVLQAEPLEPSDVVVTSGADGIYPPDITVGTVANVIANAADITKQAQVESMASQDTAVIVRD